MPTMVGLPSVRTGGQTVAQVPEQAVAEDGLAVSLSNRYSTQPFASVTTLPIFGMVVAITLSVGLPTGASSAPAPAFTLLRLGTGVMVMDTGAPLVPYGFVPYPCPQATAPNAANPNAMGTPTTVAMKRFDVNNRSSLSGRSGRGQSPPGFQIAVALDG